jgi:hypothetical protein
MNLRGTGFHLAPQTAETFGETRRRRDSGVAGDKAPPGLPGVGTLTFDGVENQAGSAQNLLKIVVGVENPMSETGFLRYLVKQVKETHPDSGDGVGVDGVRRGGASVRRRFGGHMEPAHGAQGLVADGSALRRNVPEEVHRTMG